MKKTKQKEKAVKIVTAKNQKNEEKDKRISKLKQFKGKIDLDVDLNVLRDRKK